MKSPSLRNRKRINYNEFEDKSEDDDNYEIGIEYENELNEDYNNENKKIKEKKRINKSNFVVRQNNLNKNKENFNKHQFYNINNNLNYYENSSTLAEGLNNNKFLNQKHYRNEKRNNKKPKNIMKNLINKFPIKPFNIETDYFYQNLLNEEWNKISIFIEKSLSNENLTEYEVYLFFNKFPNLFKGSHNLQILQQILNNKAGFKTNINSFKIISNYILSTYYIPKPSVFEVYFFPNPDNEIYILYTLLSCKESIDICIYTINNIKFQNIIESLVKNRIKIRIICDNEMSQKQTSNIYYLASLGIPIKTNEQIRKLMHNKFAVIDNSVVISGSFNWTYQAVNYNQENILIIENKILAEKYCNEFNKLWNNFEIIIDKNMGIRRVEENIQKKIMKDIINDRKLALKLQENPNFKIPIKKSKDENQINIFNSNRKEPFLTNRNLLCNSNSFNSNNQNNILSSNIYDLDINDDYKNKSIWEKYCSIF